MRVNALKVAAANSRVVDKIDVARLGVCPTNDRVRFSVGEHVEGLKVSRACSCVCSCVGCALEAHQCLGAHGDDPRTVPSRE